MEEKNVFGTHPDYAAEIARIVRSRLTPPPMRERLLDYHENDIALALELLSSDERAKLFRVLGTARLGEVLEYSDERAEYLAELPPRHRAEVLAGLEASSAAEYLEELDEDERDALLNLIAEEPRKEISLFTSFDKELIGSRMSTNYIAVSEGVGVRGAMTELVEQAAEHDNVSTIYAVDGDGHLVGAIELTELIVARADTPLASIVMTSYPYVYATEPTADCMERLRGYSEDSIPVLDSENRLCGVLTAQELTEITRDEIGDDYAKLGGLSAEEEENEPIFRSVGKRLPWLAVLFALGLLVSGVVGIFERVVSGLTLIVSFQSLILGMAGNVGTQSLAVTIRRLSDGELRTRDKLVLVTKEARIGFLNGAILGVLSFLLIGAYLWLVRGVSVPLAFSVSLCTGIALILSMLLSGIAGTTVPILLGRLGIDPAVASGPFITTTSDLVAVVTYYGLAWLFLLGI